MRLRIKLICLLSIFSLTPLVSQDLYPVIEGYGGVVAVSDSAFLPDVSQEYKLIFDVTLRPGEPKDVNPGLDGVARVLNLHAMAGVLGSNMDVKVAVRQGATYSILDDAFYSGKFEIDNPNIDLIKKLVAAGVEIYVCGQTLTRAKIPEENVLEEVKVALSAFTTTTNFRMKGYAYYKF